MKNNGRHVRQLHLFIDILATPELSSVTHEGVVRLRPLISLSPVRLIRSLMVLFSASPIHPGYPRQGASRNEGEAFWFYSFGSPSGGDRTYFSHIWFLRPYVG